MEIVKEIASFVPFVSSLVAFIVSFVFYLRNKHKAFVNGETATETAATLDIEAKARECIAQAEKLYNYKVNGVSLGAQKKEAVLSKLRLYAVEKGYTVDEAELSKMVDDFVAFMNTNKK